jgi:P27 family predicted phage terminase small subunit
MAPPRKRSERRQRRNTPDVSLTVVQREPVRAPEAPKDWLKVTRERWEAFWGSEVARAVDPATDSGALVRLFGFYDEIERATRAVREQRFVEGSRGQARLNPAAKYVVELETAVRALEDRFGMTPRARLQLGIDFATAQRSLAKLNKAFEVPDSPDPRLEAVDGDA